MLIKKWNSACVLSIFFLFSHLNLHGKYIPEPTSWQEKRLIDMYSWFNTIAQPETTFHKEDLSHFFTPDFIMQANGQEITHNYEDLFEHFEAFRQSGKQMRVILPFDEVVIDRSGHKVAIRYSITEQITDGKSYELLVIAIWHFACDGRLKRMNEVFCTK